jgi:hypothetical protein
MHIATTENVSLCVRMKVDRVHETEKRRFALAVNCLDTLATLP